MPAHSRTLRRCGRPALCQRERSAVTHATPEKPPEVRENQLPEPCLRHRAKEPVQCHTPHQHPPCARRSLPPCVRSGCPGHPAREARESGHFASEQARSSKQLRQPRAPGLLHAKRVPFRRYSVSGGGSALVTRPHPSPGPTWGLLRRAAGAPAAARSPAAAASADASAACLLICERACCACVCLGGGGSKLA